VLVTIPRPARREAAGSGPHAAGHRRLAAVYLTTSIGIAWFGRLVGWWFHFRLAAERRNPRRPSPPPSRGRRNVPSASSQLPP